MEVFGRFLGCFLGYFCRHSAERKGMGLRTNVSRVSVCASFELRSGDVSARTRSSLSRTVRLDAIRFERH
jgi:hypothetical protein